MKATRFLISVMVLAGMAAQDALSEQTPMGTAFTYQGRLEEHGHSAHGEYDFLFRLFDAATEGTQIGKDLEIGDWPVADGLFSVVLDFGENVFTGDARWLEVHVRPGDSGGDYTVLSPRQEVTPAPYAIHAATAAAVQGVIRGEGTPGYIPIFTQPRYIEDSVIYQSDAGKLGIGTPNPTANLHVTGSVAIVDGTQGANKVLTSDTNGAASWQPLPDTGIPAGVIVMWSGSIDTIPEGWALCDGTPPRPDLRDRFVVGAGAEYSVGQTGGEKMHVLTVDEMPRHHHTYQHHPTWYFSGDSEPGGKGNLQDYQTGDTGGDQPHENRPPYYAVAYIVKL